MYDNCTIINYTVKHNAVATISQNLIPSIVFKLNPISNDFENAFIFTNNFFLLMQGIN